MQSSTINDFKVIDLICKGDVSDIWQGVHIATETKVFVVTVNKKAASGRVYDEERVQELENIVTQLQHPNILRYHKIVQNDNTIGIIMEYPMGVTLRDFLVKQPDKKISEQEAKLIFKQIISGVEYIHLLNKVYRNLNLRNIYIDPNTTCIKLGDFLICPKEGPIYNKPLSNANNTSSYHFYAPEIWLEDGNVIGLGSDIFSLGVILYVMVCGCYPFDGKHEFDIFLSVRKGSFNLPSHISDECISLIKAMLNVDASKRPTIAQLKAFPWLREQQQPQQQQFPTMDNNNFYEPRRMMNKRVLGGLDAIKEEGDDNNSPSIAMSRLSLDNPNSPTSPSQYSSFQTMSPFHQTPTRTNSKKRLSSEHKGSDIQNLFEYMRIKQENSQQLVSSIQLPGGFSGFTEETNFSEDGPPKPKRRSSDSVLQNQEIVQMMGRTKFDPTPFVQPSDINPFAPVKEEPSSGSTGTRHSRSLSQDHMKATSRASRSPGPGRSRSNSQTRRRPSFHANNPPTGSVDGFSNITLPQTAENGLHTGNNYHSQDIKSELNSMQYESYNPPPNYHMEPRNDQQQQNIQALLAHVQSFSQNSQQPQALSLQEQLQEKQLLQQRLREQQARMSNPQSLSPHNQSSPQAQHTAQKPHYQMNSTPPFMDPEIEKVISNLSAQDLIAMGSDLESLDEWVNSIIKV